MKDCSTSRQAGASTVRCCGTGQAASVRKRSASATPSRRRLAESGSVSHLRTIRAAVSSAPHPRCSAVSPPLSRPTNLYESPVCLLQQGNRLFDAEAPHAQLMELFLAGPLGRPQFDVLLNLLPDGLRGRASVTSTEVGHL